MQSTAKTVQEYLDSLPEDQGAIIQELRKVVLDALPEGYEEAMAWGMICYQVPLAIFPDTYNKQPLVYAGIAVQKHHFSLYLMSVYQNVGDLELLKAAYAHAGKRLDMGKSCIRFKRLSELELESISHIISNTSMEKFIESYKESKRGETRQRNI